jgi:hypothetical protein
MINGQLTELNFHYDTKISHGIAMGEVALVELGSKVIQDPM